MRRRAASTFKEGGRPPKLRPTSPAYKGLALRYEPLTGYLIYHPSRVVTRLGGMTIYHDAPAGNQDPYIWNTRFLHSYCHITQMHAEAGDINFWVSGDHFPNFSYLYCDLVFVVEAKLYWSERNNIEPTDPLVDSSAAYVDHYRWAFQHPFKRPRRYTLKADPSLSFQPQDSAGNLIDVMPFLMEHGLALETLRPGLRAGFNSKPLKLGIVAEELYYWLFETAYRKLGGPLLQVIRQQHQELASPEP